LLINANKCFYKIIKNKVKKKVKNIGKEIYEDKENVEQMKK